MFEASLGVYLFLFLALYFEVFLLITFLEKKRSGAAPRAAMTHFPSVAIVVPCFNEQDTIEKTLRSALALDYPRGKLSVVVVDDGSTDGTLALARRFEHDGAEGVKVTVHTKRNGGKHTALNYALRREEAEIVGCLDADSWVERGALREVIAAFNADRELMAVTPAVKVSGPKRLLEVIQKAEYALAIFSRKMFGNLGALFVTPGPFSFYRREVFARIGLFRRAHDTEDMEMALRMQANHLPIDNIPAARVYTNVPPDLPTLIRQRTRWTRGFIENSKDYAFMYFNRRYGALGLFVLPTGIIAIFSAIYLAGYFLATFIARAMELFVRTETVGIANALPFSRFDWFFLNTQTYTFIIVTLVIMTAVVIGIGKKIGAEKPVSRDVLYFILFYGFIAPLWLFNAVVHAALARRVSWR